MIFLMPLFSMLPKDIVEIPFGVDVLSLLRPCTFWIAHYGAKVRHFRLVITTHVPFGIKNLPDQVKRPNGNCLATDIEVLREKGLHRVVDLDIRVYELPLLTNQSLVFGDVARLPLLLARLPLHAWNVFYTVQRSAANSQRIGGGANVGEAGPGMSAAGMSVSIRVGNKKNPPPE